MKGMMYMKISKKRNRRGRRLARVLMITSIIAINIAIVVLMILWTNYVNRYKQDTSSAVLSVLKICISNSEYDNVDETCSQLIDYIDTLPNRTVVIYDNKYNPCDIYHNRKNKININIKDNPTLLSIINNLDNGHELVKINNHNEEIFWDWINAKDGSRKLLIIYGVEVTLINEFSFVFIISFILIIFILMLTASLYINYRNDYLSSMINLYNRRVSSIYDDK
jgi:hypothetical protein